MGLSQFWIFFRNLKIVFANELFDGLRHLRSARCVLCLFCAWLPSVSPAQGQPFAGEWIYEDACAADGFGLYNNIKLELAGSNQYQGVWYEGTRSRGWDGRLKGSVRQGVLALERCVDAENSSWKPDPRETCPQFVAIGAYKRQKNRLIRVTKSVEWPTADQFFLKVQHPKNRRLPKPQNCPE